jgi:hypothetical protein
VLVPTVRFVRHWRVLPAACHGSLVRSPRCLCRLSASCGTGGSYPPPATARSFARRGAGTDCPLRAALAGPTRPPAMARSFARRGACTDCPLRAALAGPTRRLPRLARSLAAVLVPTVRFVRHWRVLPAACHGSLVRSPRCWYRLLMHHAASAVLAARPLDATSSFAAAMKASIARDPLSPPARSRTDTVPSAASRSPTTSM